MTTKQKVDRMRLSGESLVIRDDGPVLMGGRCSSCETVAFPRTSICPSCMSETIDDEPMPRKGKLYSWTSVHVGSPSIKKPMHIGYVDLENGVRVFSHLMASDGHALAIDQTVEVTVANVGITAEGLPIETFVFVPASGGTK